MRIKYQLIIFIVFFLLISTFNCKKDSTGYDNNESTNQKVIFHVENMARGYQFNNWYIDNKGNTWHLKCLPSWNKEHLNLLLNEDKISFYEADSINQIYEECRDTIITKVNIDSLNHYSSLIEQASSGEYSQELGGGADIGTVLYGCLLFNEKDKKYRKVILCLLGDAVYLNLDNSAIKITKWLINLNPTKYLEWQIEDFLE